MKILLSALFIFILNCSLNAYSRTIKKYPEYQERLKIELIAKGRKTKDRYIIKFSTKNNLNSFQVLSAEKNINI